MASNVGPIDDPISPGAFARRVGVDRKAVLKAVDNGRLERSVKRGSKGRITIAPAMGEREWNENRDPARVRHAGKSPRASTLAAQDGQSERPRNTKTAPPTHRPSDLGGGRRLRTTAHERRRLIRAQARKAELVAKKLAGQLVEAAAVKRAAFEAARTIRDNVLNIPDRIASELAVETDPGKIHARLDLELRQALGAAADVLSYA
jgi:hypothetical protein